MLDRSRWLTQPAATTSHAPHSSWVMKDCGRFGSPALGTCEVTLEACRGCLGQGECDNTTRYKLYYDHSFIRGVLDVDSGVVAGARTGQFLDIPCPGRITQLQVRSGAVIDGIGFKYRSTDSSGTSQNTDTQSISSWPGVNSHDLEESLPGLLGYHDSGKLVTVGGSGGVLGGLFNVTAPLTLRTGLFLDQTCVVSLEVRPRDRMSVLVHSTERIVYMEVFSEEWDQVVWFKSFIWDVDNTEPEPVIRAGSKAVSACFLSDNQSPDPTLRVILVGELWDCVIKCIDDQGNIWKHGL